MPGPYFPGQEPNDCGCYYPDVTRVYDDVSRQVIVTYCVVHGWREISDPELPDFVREIQSPQVQQLRDYFGDGASRLMRLAPRPDWIEHERERLRSNPRNGQIDLALRYFDGLDPAQRELLLASFDPAAREIILRRYAQWQKNSK